MNSKEIVIRALNFNHPERIPVQSWVMPNAVAKYGRQLEEAIENYCVGFSGPEYTDHIMGEKWHMAGTFTDGWGCVWDNLQYGIIGEVKVHPLDDYEKLKSYKAPMDLLRLGWEKVDGSIRENADKFICTPWSVNIFERMQFLRGTEKLFMDLAEESGEVILLRDIVFEFYREWLKLWLNHDVDGVVFSDDWGTQNSLLVSPELFRKIFKPCYQELISMCKRKDKYVFFHSDGNILSILDDFVDMGVDAINCQTWLMGMEKISEKYRGRLTFWGELDRQHALPYGTVEDVRNSVIKMKKMLILNGGGLIGVVSAGADSPLENIIQGLKCWNE